MTTGLISIAGKCEIIKWLYGRRASDYLIVKFVKPQRLRDIRVQIGTEVLHCTVRIKKRTYSSADALSRSTPYNLGSTLYNTI
jgi:hypothetical protein